MPMTRQERISLHKKQERMQLSKEIPANADVIEGSPVYRQTFKGLYQYVKFNGRVYSHLLTEGTKTLQEEINDTVQNITVEEITIDGTLDVSSGGTGATTLTVDGVLFGNGTAAISAVDLSTNGNIVAGGAAPAAVTGANLAGGGLAATTGNGTLVLAVGAGTGIDVSTNAIAVDVSDFMSNGANNYVVTATGTDAMNAEAQLTFDGDVLAITGTGTAKSNKDILTITNDVNAADMDGTGTSILFNQWYYDGSSPAVADAGRISILTENDWTSTTSTQDSSMSFQTAINGTVTEMVKITSAGTVDIANDLQLISDASVFNMGDGGHFSITHDGSDGATIASQGALIIDCTGTNVTIDGHTGVTLQSTNSGDILLDSVADVVLDADGDQISMKFGGAAGQIDFSNTNSGDGIIQQKIDTKDLIIQQYDGTEILRLRDAVTVVIRSCYVNDFAINIKPEASGRHYASGTADYQENYSMHGIHDLQSGSFDADFGTTNNSWSE